MSTFNEILDSKEPVLIDFFAEWCGPCKMMKPILQELKNKVGEGVKIITIDVDKNPGIANEYKVMGVPTLMLFKNKEMKWRQSGVVSASALEQIIQKN